MNPRVFVDTAGWCAVVNRRDDLHERASSELKRLREKETILVTSDYVIDESCTLLKARAGSRAATAFLDQIERAVGLSIEWVGQDRFDAATDLFRKHADQGFSFTDCTSFVIMQDL